MSKFHITLKNFLGDEKLHSYSSLKKSYKTFSKFRKINRFISYGNN